MSELKAYKAYNRWLDEEMPTPNDDLICNEVYLKSEADKVIEELKQKINEAQTELELWRDGSIISEAHQKELDEKRHSDYKRCLAMAKWCRARYNEWAAYYPFTTTKQMKFLDKWAKRWIKIAEQFKETK